jgi:hypothetical protein
VKYISNIEEMAELHVKHSKSHLKNKTSEKTSEKALLTILENET